MNTKTKQSVEELEANLLDNGQAMSKSEYRHKLQAYKEAIRREYREGIEEKCDKCIDAWFDHEHGDTVGCAVEHLKSQLKST